MGPSPFTKESDLPQQMGKLRLGSYGWQKAKLGFGPGPPAACWPCSENMEDLSHCAGREDFLEAEELVLGGEEEVDCQSWEESDSRKTCTPRPCPAVRPVAWAGSRF